MSSPITKRWVLFSDYGYEGWSPIAEADTLAEIVAMREAGGAGYSPSVIVEVIPAVEAYARVHAEEAK